MKDFKNKDFDFGMPIRIITERRDHFICRMCIGKKVLHVGCFDSGFYFKRKKLEELLHIKLQGPALELYGVDISENGIQQMEKDGFDKILFGDVCNGHDRNHLVNYIKGHGGIDLIVVPEVIEHVSDPIEFFMGLLSIAKDLNAVCILTTPNAFSFVNIKNIMLSRETVHPDHNFYFSPKTLLRVLEKVGVKDAMELKALFAPSSSAWRAIVKRIVTRNSYQMCDTLVASFR